MTPRSPDEALHFRGKTLTPESPRPLHVAEPANIPVLQNQMDPVFNDTSTYEKPEFALEGGQHVPHAAPRSQPQQQQNGQPPLEEEQQQQQQHAASGSDSAGVRESAGQMQDLGQQQQQQYQHPGSYHTGSLSENEMMSKNETSSSAAAFPPNLSAPTTTNAITSTATTTTPGTRNEERNDSLTALPLSDPSVNSLPHQASLNRPPPPSSSHAPQGFPAANEVDHPMTDWTAPAAPEARLDTNRASSHDNAPNSGEGGVDFQNLLDNLPSSSSAVPSAPAVSETAPSLMQNYASAIPQATNNADGASDEALQNPMGLPPRPPAQEDFAAHPNFHPSDDVSAYHQLPSNHPTYPSSQPQSNNNHQSNLGVPVLAAAGAPGTSSDASSLPPPPGLSLKKAESSSSETRDSSLKNGRTDKPVARSFKNNDEDAPWGPEVQRKYDDFLHNERIYVTEGLWDRFPPGSRLFVGNLPTERVTKRDLFHIFHKYGKLAQVSIKQAYGFIQFLDSSACKKALDAEQGAVVRGRKIHLEISKPQRNTRPGPAPPEPPRAPPPRRSRSPPEFRGGPSNGRGLRAPGDRYDRNYEPASRLPFSDFRDELTHRRRDDYRPLPRSPSPRGFRGRDGYRSRDRTPERYDRRDRRRSRSPPYGRDRRYRTPSPRGRSYDDADLPVPRRAPRDIPDVQILVLEEVDRNFIFHVENSFRNRGLRVDVLVLGPRIPLNAAVQRQIIEGVLAVVRLARPNQFSRKIPLQLFDRSGGPDNLRFNEYPELEPNMAAEIVFHAQPQRGGPPVPFTSATPFGIPPLPPPVQMPQPPLPPLSNQPNVANVMPSLDGSALQSILSALQQRPAVPAIQPPAFPPPNTPQAPADLASILNNATRPPVTAAPSQPMPPQPFPVQPPNAQMVPDPNLLSLLSKGLGGQQPQAHQGPMGPQVQNIINQLTKWKQ